MYEDRPIRFVANSVWGTSGLSGGDNIFINLAKFLQKSEQPLAIYTWEDGYELCRNSGINEKSLRLWPAKSFNFLGFPVHYLIRTLVGCWQALRIKNTGENRRGFVYSASDFWPDVLPAFLMSRRLQMPWAAAFYLFAPLPFSRKSPYRGWKWLIGFLYWLQQLPVYWLVKNFADFVLVTSQPDVDTFITVNRDHSKVIVVRGGVDITDSERYRQSGQAVPVDERKYGACFVGRFHYQKGVMELIDIWELVCKQWPDAKLAMVGLDSLEEEMRQKIKDKALTTNIEILGPLTGQAKYEVFKQSKMILHPAIYDSGGMAAAEAMAWGLPGVSFDLESLKTYYPQGMLKTPCFDLEKFAENILKLLEDEKLYGRFSREARDLIIREWDWDKRARAIAKQITGESL